MTTVRLELNGDGIRSLLASGDVQAMLNDKAEAVAAAAQARGVTVDGTPGAVPLPIVVREAGSRTRARALVVADHEAGLAVESKHRLLVGSLDAAR